MNRVMLLSHNIIHESRVRNNGEAHNNRCEGFAKRETASGSDIAREWYHRDKEENMQKPAN